MTTEETEQSDRPDSALRRGGITRARAARIGAVGLATLAVLSTGSFAERGEVAVPAAVSTAPSVDYASRADRADRSDRDSLRPSAARTSPSAAATSTAAGKAAEKKAAEKKAAAKKAAAKKAAAKKPVAKKAAAKAAGGSAGAAPRAVGSRYTRVDLNVRAEPAENGKLLSVVDSGSKLTIAAKTSGQWQSVVHKGAVGWVKGRYLQRSKPTATSTGSSGSSGSGGIATGACAGGSSVESGLTSDAVKVHRAVCARFPQIASYGGVRADSLPEHPAGRALDCMLPNYSSAGGNALGWEIANWLRTNARRLGISQILFDQKIWTVQRGGEGWRYMSSRGGATANHRDHVHVTVYGSAATG